MSTVTNNPSELERTVVAILRKLPEERQSSLVDYAKFLATQSDLVEENGDAKWERLLAKPEAKQRLRELAKEARQDIASGQISDIAIGEDGYLKAA